MITPQNRLLSIAPMMQCTDRHFRAFLRLFSPHILLYSEMVTTGAILRGGDTDRFLGYDDFEHPVALQLGGNDPKELGVCSRIGEDFGYDEINLNVGCPSDNVSAGKFGACLMRTPELVAECLSEMQKSVSIPVTVKSRIGVDELDSFDDFHNFIKVVRSSGCEVFIVHARKAWLEGLSPKQNRTKPPLRYEDVYRIKEMYPELTIIINGGITDWVTIETMLQKVDGVMIGRKAYDDPYFLAVANDRLFHESSHRNLTREELVRKYFPYLKKSFESGVPLKEMLQHLMGLFFGVSGAKKWKRHLLEMKRAEDLFQFFDE